MMITSVAVKGVEFPEMIGPVTDPNTVMQELGDTGNVSIRLATTRTGGGMCDGDETELVIENNERLFTRVINLYGDGPEGLLVYGSEKKLPKNEAITIAKVAVVKTTSVPVERLVLFGAKTKKELGRFANAPIPCRISKEDAQRFSNNSGYPQGSAKYRSSTSYRILGKDSCVVEAKIQKTDFSSLQSCW